MKRLILSVVIASTLGLTACGGKSSNEHKDDAVPSVPQAHLAFDPAAPAPVVPLPSDLLFNGSSDGTLMVPGKETGNFSDPAIALGALDGWSTTESITIPVVFPKYDSQQNPVKDLALMTKSVEQEGVARVFEVQKMGPLAFDNNCKTAAAADSLKVCSVQKELQYGVDFTTQVVNNEITIVPLKPFKQNQSYLYAITDKVLDTYDRPISGSATFNVLKTDSVLPSPDQQALQAAVHSYDDNLSQNGVDPKTVTYASLFTTQSITNVVAITKAKMAADYFAGFDSDNNRTGNFGPYSPQLVKLANGKYVEQVFQADGVTPKTAADVVQTGDSTAGAVLSNALLYHAKIKLPIYSACSSVKCLNPDGSFAVNGRWMASGDSPIAILSALQSNDPATHLSEQSFAAQAKAQGVDPAKALANPSLLVGKHFTLADGSPVDKFKLLTRYNPLPAIQTDANGQPLYETVDVQITIPKETNNPLTPIPGLIPDIPDIPIPDTGFQVSIGMHGIGTIRQTTLAYSGIFAANFPEVLKPFLEQLGLNVQNKTPVATITIDMPLHGERSYRTAASGPYDVSATRKRDVAPFGLDPTLFENGNVLNFVRINSPLTIRSNFRQATVDELSLRLLLPEISKNLLALNPTWAAKYGSGELQTGVFNTNQVTAAGLSLGAMISTSFTAAANSGVVDPSTGQAFPLNPYKINGVSLIAPAGGLAGAFAGSASFGPQLFAAINLDPKFQALVAAAAAQQGIDKDDNPAAYNALVKVVYKQFIPSFGFAVQSAIDAIDPVNFAPIIKGLNASDDASKHVPVHLIEIVGDGGSNPSDQTLPNRFDGLPVGDETLPFTGYPLAGTEPLITALGLPCVSPVAGTPVEGYGAVRFLKGKHSSFIDPSPIDGGDADTFQLVTEDMQAQASVFASTAGAGKPEIETAKDGLIKTCGE